MKVIVVPYDPTWPLAFGAIKDELLSYLGASFNGSIEHVGSTSLPGLWAKPIIDIDIIAPSEQHNEIIEALVRSGRYLNEGRDDNFERWSFKLVPDTNPDRPFANTRRNLYLNVPDSLAVKNHLAIRTCLRQRPDLVEAYSEVKRQLAEKEFGHIDEYVAGKSEVLGRIFEAAGGFSEAEMERIRGANLMPGERPLR